MDDIVKGTTIRAQWFAATDACLAGAQPKVGARLVDVQGVVRHIYGSSPDGPVDVLYVDVDGWTGPVVTDCSCGGPHVAVKPAHVVAIAGNT